MVAAVLLAVGVLAAAGAARVCTRLATLGDRHARAAAAASSRFERLRAGGCGAAAGGAASHGAVDETWSVTPGAAALAVDVNVSFVEGGRSHVVRFAGSLPCAP